MHDHLLVISDLHIGEYAKEMDRIGYIKGSVRQDEDLCAFLEYHQTHRINGKPWRLIINGDFLDFIAVTFQPTPQHEGLEVTEEETRWGLDSSADKAVWKLARLIDRHHMLFTYLADFVAQGNTLEILYGNHDVEFWWSEVHDAFRAHLQRIFFGGEAVPGVNPKDFTARIKFHPWFIYQPGRFYIEHGNQYDDFSSFEYRLNPIAPYDDEQLAMPVSHLAIRYFVNQYQGFRSHNKDNWTLLDYLRWLRQQGRANTLWILKLYLIFGSRMVAYAQHSQVADNQPMHQVHTQGMAQLSTQTGMPLELLEKVDGLRRSPVTRSMGRTFQTLGLDHLLMATVWVIAAFLVFVIPFSILWTLGLWAACGAGYLLCRKLWPRVRAKHLGGAINTNVAPKVDGSAAELVQILPVRYVFFGHTHKPCKLQVRQDPPGFYINSGSWLPPQIRERHGPDNTCPSRLTFIVYRDADITQPGQTPDARLFRWCSRDSTPVPFDPRVHMQHLDPEEVDIPLDAPVRLTRPAKLRKRALTSNPHHPRKRS